MPFRLLAIVLASALLMGALAGAQSVPPDPAEEDPQVLLAVDVGYNTAYRDPSWASVDVLVTNEQDDIDGYVEVRLFDFGGQLQSPVYRLPANCPELSRKRFRLTAYFENTARVEAWLFENNRPAMDVPAYIELQPVRPQDLMALTLDDDAAHFGFLIDAVQREGQTETIRIHRHTIPPEFLTTLPDYVQSYKVFNAIIVGNVEAERVPARFRGLITQYIREGGTLIVCTGINAQLHRESWLDELTGVEVGAVDYVDEAVLAEVFPETERLRARSGEMIAVARFRPMAEGIEVYGAEHILATRRGIGKGQVYTLAVDTESAALERTSGYKALWREMITGNHRGHGLNIDRLASLAAWKLPDFSGVTIQSLDFVMTYLLLYIVFGFVLNWLFWSMLKRREYAWLTLMVVSAAFLAYAMFHGIGRRESSEMSRLRVFHYGLGNGPVAYAEATGILTARTQQYSGSLANDTMLMRSGAGSALDFASGWGYGLRNTQAPYQFIQDSTPRFDGLRVGASEMRFLLTDGHLPAQPGIEGTLTLDENSLSGTLHNRTGHTLRDVQLVLDGYAYELPAGDTWEIDIPATELGTMRPEQVLAGSRSRYDLWGAREGQEAMLAKYLLASLVTPPGNDDFFLADAVAGPYLIAQSITQPETEPVAVEQELNEGFSRSFVVAEIGLQRSGERRIALISQGGDRHGFQKRMEPPEQFWLRVAAQRVPIHQVTIHIPAPLASDSEAKILLECYYPKTVVDPPSPSPAPAIGGGAPNLARGVGGPAGARVSRSDFAPVHKGAYDWSTARIPFSDTSNPPQPGENVTTTGSVVPRLVLRTERALAFSDEEIILFEYEIENWRELVRTDPFLQIGFDGGYQPYAVSAWAEISAQGNEEGWRPWR